MTSVGDQPPTRLAAGKNRDRNQVRVRVEADRANSPDPVNLL